jgi:hypothetical protein
MLICVEAEASRVEGAGETVTREPASAADAFSRGEVQGGEVAGGRLAWAPARAEWSVTTATIPAAAGNSVRPASTARRRMLGPLTP